MPRLAPTLRLQEAGPHFEAHFPLEEALIQDLKLLPGVEAIYKGKVFSHWLIPRDCFDLVEPMFEHYGYRMPGLLGLDERRDLTGKVNERLHGYQVGGVASVLNAIDAETRGYLLSYEMGLGKTPTAIECVRLLEHTHKRVLVVCPALVRQNWSDEIRRWWPDAPAVGVAATGKQLANPVIQSCPILVTSYGLLGKLKALDLRYDAIIFDEIHYLKNDRSTRSKAAKHVRLQNLKALCLGLTGTPVLSEPQDLWNQWDVLLPGAAGRRFKFCDRYCHHVSNRYATKGYDWKGLEPGYAAELQSRLAAISHRVTKQEVAHLLPPFLVQAVRVRGKGKPTNYRELFEDLGSGIRKQHELDRAVAEAGASKIGLAIEACADAMLAGQQVACLAWFRKTAKAIAAEIPGAVYVDGALTVQARMAKIEHARANRLPLVATMASINVGIDLTAWTTAVFAELYWQPAAMVQALGRFSRLSGKLPSTCLLLTLKGSLDEPIAYTLMRRLKEQAAILAPGQSEAGLLEGLSEPDDSWINGLREAAAGRLEEDAYL